jgi:hypothetical protein
VIAAGSAPLVRWDGLRLVLSLPLLEARLARWLAGGGRLEGLRLEGAGDAVGLSGWVHWGGVRIRVAVEVAELRLRHRRLGFRVRRPRALGGVRLPRSAVNRLLESFASETVHVVGGAGIVVVDLRRWIPEGVSVSVVTVQALGDAVHVWLGPGALEDLPAPELPALPAGSETLDRHDGLG